MKIEQIKVGERLWYKKEIPGTYWARHLSDSDDSFRYYFVECTVTKICKKRVRVQYNEKLKPFEAAQEFNSLVLPKNLASSAPSPYYYATHDSYWTQEERDINLGID